jgi:hypothetical protein
MKDGVGLNFFLVIELFYLMCKGKLLLIVSGVRTRDMARRVKVICIPTQSCFTCLQKNPEISPTVAGHEIGWRMVAFNIYGMAIPAIP